MRTYWKKNTWIFLSKSIHVTKSIFFYRYFIYILSLGYLCLTKITRQETKSCIQTGTHLMGIYWNIIYFQQMFRYWDPWIKKNNNHLLYACADLSNKYQWTTLQIIASISSAFWQTASIPARLSMLDSFSIAFSLEFWVLAPIIYNAKYYCYILNTYP